MLFVHLWKGVRDGQGHGSRQLPGRADEIGQANGGTGWGVSVVRYLIGTAIVRTMCSFNEIVKRLVVGPSSQTADIISRSHIVCFGYREKVALCQMQEPSCISLAETLQPTPGQGRCTSGMA